MQQQQPVQQRVITLAQAVGGRHFTLAKPEAPRQPGCTKAQCGAVQSVEAKSAQKNNANAALAAQIALARYSEATERERLVQSVQCRRSTLALQC